MKLTKKLIGKNPLIRAGQYLGNGIWMLHEDEVYNGFMLNSTEVVDMSLGVEYKENCAEAMQSLIDSTTVPCQVTNRLFDYPDLDFYVRVIEIEGGKGFYINENLYQVFKEIFDSEEMLHCNSCGSLLKVGDNKLVIAAITAGYPEYKS